jgi:hypothetical protein
MQNAREGTSSSARPCGAARRALRRRLKFAAAAADMGQQDVRMRPTEA